MKNLYILLFALISTGVFAQTASYTKSIVTSECWANNAVIATATQQNAIAIYENFVYVVYYNADRYLCISRSDNYGDDGWVSIQLNHRYEMRNGVYDNHNTPNIAISPIDNRIHLSFDMHKRDLRYMLSWANTATIRNEEFTADRFSSVRDYLEADKTVIKDVTYPRFFVGKNNHLFFMYRVGGSGNGDTYMVKYNDDATWSTPFEIIDGNIGSHNGSSSRCAYFNDVQFKSGKIHMTWVWRETPDATTNHDLMYAYSDNDGVSWKNSAGENISMPMNLNSNNLKVATIPTNTGLINHNGCAVDGDGNVHAILRIDGSYIHYFGVLGTDGKYTWSMQTAATFTGDRPKLYCDRTTNTLYLLVRQSSTLRLYATTSNNKQWNQWTQIKSFSDRFSSSSNSIISNSGNLLSTVAVSSDGRLQLIKWTLSSGVTSIHDGNATSSSREDKLSLYPNPTHESFTIELDGATSINISIHDMSGKVLSHESCLGSSLSIQRHFKSGIYLVRIIDDKNDTYLRKLLVR